MSNILFLSQLLPFPLDTGPKVRAYYVLKYLSKAHCITLLAFCRPDDDQQYIEHLLSICKEVYTIPLKRSNLNNIISLGKSLVTSIPFVIIRDYKNCMAEKLKQTLQEKEYDAIHVDQLWMAQYVLNLHPLYKIKNVLDEHNACFQIFQRLAAREKNQLKKIVLDREWKILKKYEAKTCSQFDHIVTVTHSDYSILKQLVDTEQGKASEHVKNQHFHTIPICVDALSSKVVNPILNKNNILHLGTMFWLPNIEGIQWFLHKVWPLVLSIVPTATLTIAGKNPPSELKKLMHNSYQNIKVTGYVPDPIPLIEQASVFIVPILSAGGMRVKIIDAWCWGLPIVSTTIGAEGIDYRDGENILIADTAEKFAEAVGTIINNPDVSSKLSSNGRVWVEKTYDWRLRYLEWDPVYS